jgi:hypothetical protein
MQCTRRIFESIHCNMENFSGTYHYAMLVFTRISESPSVEFLVLSAVSRQSCGCHKSYHTDMSWSSGPLCDAPQAIRKRKIQHSWEPVVLIQQIGNGPLIVISRYERLDRAASIIA